MFGATKQGRLTRKLFLIFAVFALLPTSILSLFAMNYLAGEAQRQAVDTLEYQLDNFSHEVLNRLEFSRNDMGILRGSGTAGFSNYSIDDPEAPFQPLSPSYRQRLLEGLSVLVDIEQAYGLPRVLLLRAWEDDTGSKNISTLPLQETVVFGEPDSWDLSLDSCIYNRRGRLLYATRISICGQALPANKTSLGHKGIRDFESNGAEFVAGFRNLFLKQKYGEESWWLLIAKPADEVYSSQRLFQSSFLSLALLVVLVLALASIWMIRRQMAPLPPIMSAIQRVSRQDYSQPVEINSGDEFEELAEAFNAMSSQVSRQLKTQASMSDIDQLILSRVKKEDIIRIVLEQTNEVISSDNLSMLLLPEADRGLLYHADRDDTIRLDHIDTAPLKDLALRVLDLQEEQLPDWINRLGSYPCRYLRLLPIITEQELTGCICLGFHQLPPQSAELDTLGASYAQRIAVALANAEWEDRLYQQAHYDSLTGLPNRPSMIDRLGHVIESSRREDSSFALLFLDLDDFKLINDSLGHNSGDELIRSVAERLRLCLRAEDTIARLGGDEFLILSGRCASETQAADMARRIAAKALAAVNESASIDGREIRAAASVGIAIYPKDGEDSQGLIKNADTAMYHSKSLGQGQYQFYSEDLNAESLQLVQLGTDINNALDSDQFVLHYQPKLQLGSYQVVGAEALVRWQHPQRGLLYPAAFIEQAEKLGLIGRLGDWVLQSACAQLARWCQHNPELKVSINVSALQMRENGLEQRIEALLEQHQIPGSMLELEITEGVLLHDLGRINGILQRIRELGVHISIDDYGTGYSSLSYMKHLPADTLKIDRDFIINLAHNKADQAIVHSTITLAHDLGISVIAEGVDDHAQVEILRQYGCDQIQGFLFSEAVSAGNFEQLLRQGLPRIGHA